MFERVLVCLAGSDLAEQELDNGLAELLEHDCHAQSQKSMEKKGANIRPGSSQHY